MKMEFGFIMALDESLPPFEWKDLFRTGWVIYQEPTLDGLLWIG